jgi:hypothetical protein
MLAPAKPVLRILDGVDGSASTAPKCQGGEQPSPTFDRHDHDGSWQRTLLAADNVAGYPVDRCIPSRYRYRTALGAHSGLLAVEAPLSLGRSRSCREAKAGEQF